MEHAPPPKASPQVSLSDLDLTFCTICVVSALMTVVIFLFALISYPVGALRPLVYTIVAVAFAVGATAAIVTQRRRLVRFSAYAVAVLIGLEALLAAKFIVQDGRHHTVTAWTNQRATNEILNWEGQFEFHPALGIKPSPSFRRDVDGLTHTADGWRTTVNVVDDTAPHVIVIGGSTTYDYGSPDAETWSSRLAALTGLYVYNLGVNAHSSADHLMTTAFWAPEFEPVCAVYYVGWNDMHSTGIVDPLPDYSEFHLRVRYNDLAADIPDAFDLVPYGVSENFALVLQIKNSLRVIFGGMMSTLEEDFFRPRGESQITRETDPVLLGYYIRNMQSIIAINEARGVRTVLLPQVLYYPALTSEEAEPGSWTRYIPDVAVPAVMDDYNEALAELAEPGKVWVVDAALRADWQAEDFIDDGHFRASGSNRFATAIAPQIAEICGSGT